MKDHLKRSFSQILVLAMIVSLLTGLTMPVRAEGYDIEETTPSTTEAEVIATEEADATGEATESIEATEIVEVAVVAEVAEVTETAADEEEVETTSEALYSFNTGRRGETCTSLPTAATSFYTGNYTYENLSELSGASARDAVPSSELYKALQTLMVSHHTHETEYQETRDYYKYTDCTRDSDKISSFYSGTSVGPEWDGGDTWNREHTWPNSKGLAGNDENDIMMLRPTAKSENSSRGNKAYGESSGYYNPNIGSFNLHGDVARIVLYVYTRWGNTSKMWGTSGVMESETVLLDWIEEDPVDTWEMSRNNVVQEITGTRNVFVDYPELAFLLFEEQIPTDMTTPSGEAGLSGGSCEITATVNDGSMGSVSLSGNNINASPKEGYEVVGFEVISGTATVTQSGNGFTVNASSDCTIQINFAPRAQVTVTYKEDTRTLDTVSAYRGDAITLADYTGTVPEDYTFVGWAYEAVDHSDQKPDYGKAGDTYIVTGDITLYALFSYVAESDSTDAGIWTLVTDASALSAGKQVVFATTEYGKVSGALDTSKHILTALDVTFSDDDQTIPAMPASAQIFTLGGEPGAWTFDSGSGSLLGATNTKTTLYYGKGSTTWTISVSGDGATVENTNTGYGRIQYNSGAPRFANYVSTQKKIQLYMLNTGEATYYTTSLCSHENTENVAAQGATCTADGYTAGVYCNDCDTYISGHEVIPSAGHNYVGEVTPPTATEEGYTTYTCPNCGDSYIGDKVPALGESEHTHTGVYQEAVPATCTEDGTIAHYACECGEKFADEACTQALTSVIDPKKGHDFTAETVKDAYKASDATCQKPAAYYVSCSRCGLSSKGTAHEKTFTSGEVDLQNHNTDQTYIENKKAATCTEDGYSGDVYCAGCSTKLEDGQVIPAAHDLTPVEGKEATHKAEGVQAHYACSACQKLFADDKASEELTADEVVIQQEDHSYGSYETSSKKHWKECACGEKTEEGEHSYGAWKTVKKATSSTKGTKERACKVCGYTQKGTIPTITSADTGDDFPLGLSLLMMLSSACALFLLTALRPRRGKYSR